MSLFTPLICTRDGVGPYRINRFRIYFRPLTREQRAMGHRHNQTPTRLAEDLALDLRDNFPRYFNPNLATVYQRSERYNNKRSLRFVLSAGLFGSEHPVAQFLAPDLHADWVGFHRVHSLGFTVQTLRREFFTNLDWAILGGATAAGAGAGAGVSWWTGAGVAAGAGVGALAGAAGGAGAMQVNQNHFLAGRRSWVIAPKAAFGRANVRNYDDIPDDALALETAACERLSGAIFQFANWIRILGSFDESVRRVWIRLLENYVAAKTFEVVPSQVWSHRVGQICYTEPPHLATERDCRASDPFTDLSRLHKEILA